MKCSGVRPQWKSKDLRKHFCFVCFFTFKGNQSKSSVEFTPSPDLPSCGLAHQREGRRWGQVAQVERVRVHGVELVMMRRPFNFVKERPPNKVKVEEEELEGDYDMFSAYPFLTERTPKEKVIVGNGL